MMMMLEQASRAFEEQRWADFREHRLQLAHGWAIDPVHPPGRGLRGRGLRESPHRRRGAAVTSAGALAIGQARMARGTRKRAQCVASYASTTLAGMRPRPDTLWPLAWAHSRMAWVSRLVRPLVPFEPESGDRRGLLA